MSFVVHLAGHCKKKKHLVRGKIHMISAYIYYNLPYLIFNSAVVDRDNAHIHIVPLTNIQNNYQLSGITSKDKRGLVRKASDESF